MLSPQALFRGLVSRILPSAYPDSQAADAASRFGRYGENAVLSYIRKQHLLADEGTYYVANNGQTGITGTTSTAFTATTPTVSIFNGDTVGNSNAKRIYLDYLYLLNAGTAFTNATSNTGTFLAVVTDNQDGVTGGTLLTPTNPNSDVPLKSVAIVRVGALTAPAVTAATRTIVGQRLLRAPVSATALTLANLDEFRINFGSVEQSASNPNAASATLEANVVSRTVNVPPVVIGPGQSAWIHIFSVAGGAVTAGNFMPELGWWER